MGAFSLIVVINLLNRLECAPCQTIIPMSAKVHRRKRRKNVAKEDKTTQFPEGRTEIEVQTEIIQVNAMNAQVGSSSNSGRLADDDDENSATSNGVEYSAISLFRHLRLPSTDQPISVEEPVIKIPKIQLAAPSKTSSTNNQSSDREVRTSSRNKLPVTSTQISSRLPTLAENGHNDNNAQAENQVLEVADDNSPIRTNSSANSEWLRRKKATNGARKQPEPSTVVSATPASVYDDFDNDGISPPAAGQKRQMRRRDDNETEEHGDHLVDISPIRTTAGPSSNNGVSSSSSRLQCPISYNPAFNLVTKPSSRVHFKVPWTNDEIECLRMGVQLYGAGKWSEIVKYGKSRFNPKRTSVDVKDKYRWLLSKNML